MPRRSYRSARLSMASMAEWSDTRVWLLTDALRARLAQADRDTGGAVLYSDDFMSKVRRAFTHSRSSFMPIIAKPTFGLGGKPRWKLDHLEVNITS